MAQARTIDVYDETQLTQAINSFVVQGFAVATRERDSVTMVKPKTFNIVWAVIGFFLCLLPLLIYLIVYATQQDQVVFIRVSGAAPRSPAVTMSPDRRLWWDGTAWQDATALAPPAAERSPDGVYWWDGTEWRPVPRTIGG